MNETEYSKPLHWDNTDGWDAEAGGGGAGGRWEGDLGQGDTCTPMADLCQCMAKTTTIL